MRGTNYGVGFGISIFFLAGGIAFLVLAGEDLPFLDEEVSGIAGDAAGSTFSMIGWIWTGVASLLLLLFVVLRLAAWRKSRIIAGGVDGTALVESAETTNTYINGMPQYRLEVTLHRADGGPVRRCVRREIVPHTALGRWGIGTQLPVRIDRDDPDRFEVLWDALPLPGARASVVDDLAVLADLAAKGLLSTDEWERAKALYLGKPPDRRHADTALLADLHRLHEEGVLSESEFNTKKWEILSRS